MLSALMCGGSQEPNSYRLVCIFDEHAQLISSTVHLAHSLGIPLNVVQKELIRLYGNTVNIKDVFIGFRIGATEAYVRMSYEKEAKVTVVSIPEEPVIKLNLYEEIPNRTSKPTPDEVSNILKSIYNTLQLKENGTLLYSLPHEAVITQYEAQTITFDEPPKSLLYITSRDPINPVLEYVDFDNIERRLLDKLQEFYKECMYKRMPIHKIKSVIKFKIKDLLEFMELLQAYIAQTPELSNYCIQKALDDYTAIIKSKFPGLPDEEVAKQRNYIDLLDCLPEYKKLKRLFLKLATDLPDAPQDDTALGPENSEFWTVCKDLGLHKIQPHQVREILGKVVHDDKITTSTHLLAAALSHMLNTIGNPELTQS